GPTVMPLTTRDGTHCYVEFALSRHDETEVWQLSDVTERVSSDERFRLLFELSADAHFLYDETGVIDCNRAAIEITGRGTKGRLIGMDLADILSPDAAIGISGDSQRDRNGLAFSDMAALARANGHHRCDARLTTVSGISVPVEVTLTSVQLAGRAMMLAALRDLTERNKAARALRASEERFRQIAEAAGEYIWEIDADGQYRFVSARIADVLGHPVDQVTGRSMFDFVAAEDRELLLQWFEETKRRKAAYRDVELRSVKPDGSLVHRRESGQPIIEADGRLTGFRGVGQDITRLHAAEIERMRTEARFRELIEGSIQGIVIHRRFMPLFANKAFADMYGFGSVDEVLAESDIFPMVCEADAGGYDQVWANQLARRQPAYPSRRVVRKRSGEKMWVDILPRPIDWMGEPALQITVVDASQKHLAEQTVQRVERHLSDAVESINEGFALWDSDDRLVMCNQRFRRLAPGFDDVAVPGASFRDILRAMQPEVATAGPGHAEDGGAPGNDIALLCAQREETLAREALLRKEFRIADHWYLISERRTADGGTVSVYSDIDALKRNEAKLRHNEEILNHYISDLEISRSRVEEQSQRLAELAEMYASERTKADAANEAKSHFLAMMSHELRTPMTGVKGMIDLLQRTALSTEQDRYVDTLRRSADALLALLNDILDFSKIEAGRLTIENTEFDLQTLCEEVLTLFEDKADDRSTVMRLRFDPAIPTPLVGDPTRLRQILNNLVGNAVKFTEKGFVEVRVRPDGAQPETGLRLRIEVEDTGIGLSEEQIARLFNAFVQADASTTRKYGGSGLGLAICRRLVEAMHGEIGVASTPGQGSTFWFTMVVDTARAEGAEPQVEQPAAAPDPAPTVTPEQAAGIRVLLAEDNPVNRMLIVSMLSGMGYKVDAVENGLKAVQRITQDTGYNLVLMDMQMPVMDGPTATKAIRDLPAPARRVPIVALTANASPEHRRGYLEAGLDEVLTKPIEWPELDRVLRTLSTRPAEEEDVPEAATDARAAAPAALDRTLIDANALHQLALAMGRESLRDMVAMMLSAAEKNLNELRAADAAGNRTQLSEVAHCLKGVSANFGAVRVAELAAALQYVDDLERPIPDVIADLADAVAATAAVMNAEFDALVGAAA
ncbi:MAG: PAS domain S-box protein, partial [Alphaproteobacteria bacterium]